MKNNRTEAIPVVDYRQYRKARRLVHECCNYIDGNGIDLDDGEECVCVQSISYSLLCRWFRAAVLPQDKKLETAVTASDKVLTLSTRNGSSFSAAFLRYAGERDQGNALSAQRC